MRIGTTVLAAVIFGACGGGGGDSQDAGATDAASSDAASSDAAGPLDANLPDDAGGPATDAALDGGQPMVTVQIVASGATFPHADGLAGQTARMTVAGVRSLALYRSMADPDPLVLYLADRPDAPVGYVPGDETTLTTLEASALLPGTYTFGRLVQSYARYAIDATLHRLDGPRDGVAQSFQVIADGTTVDGTAYDAGHYEFSFTAPGVTESWMGEDAPFPVYSATSGAIGVVEDGEWAVYFPIDLVIAESPTSDALLTLEVNMHESFRWTDLLLAGYRPDVFDVTDISSEPVLSFGGNAFALSLDAP